MHEGDIRTDDRAEAGTDSRTDGRTEERGEGRNPRNERRNDRGPRRDQTGETALNATAAPLADLPVGTDASAEPSLGNADAAGQEGQRTERRSRDRYGRDRRERNGERGDRPERSEHNSDADASAPQMSTQAPAQTADRGQSYFAVANGSTAQGASVDNSPSAPATPMADVAMPPMSSSASTIAQASPAPAAPVLSAPVAAAPVVTAPVVAVKAPTPAAPVAAAMPTVSSYTLPTADLAVVASGSGLQWVGTDASKVAAAQAAIAAEMAAAPARAPRARPAPVVVEATPLVMVETKRDLRNMELPFEKADS